MDRVAGNRGAGRVAPRCGGGAPPVKRSRLVVVEEELLSMKDIMSAFMNQMTPFMDSMKGNKQPQKLLHQLCPQPQPVRNTQPRPILPLEPVLTPARPIPLGFTIPRAHSVTNVSR